MLQLGLVRMHCGPARARCPVSGSRVRLEPRAVAASEPGARPVRSVSLAAQRRHSARAEGSTDSRQSAPGTGFPAAVVQIEDDRVTVDHVVVVINAAAGDVADAGRHQTARARGAAGSLPLPSSHSFRICRYRFHSGCAAHGSRECGRITHRRGVKQAPRHPTRGGGLDRNLLCGCAGRGR